MTKTTFETAMEVLGKTSKQEIIKLSQSAIDLIKKRQQTKVTSSKEKIELAELSKLISKYRQRDVGNFNMTDMERTIAQGTSINSVKK